MFFERCIEVRLKLDFNFTLFYFYGSFEISDISVRNVYDTSSYYYLLFH